MKEDSLLEKYGFVVSSENSTVNHVNAVVEKWDHFPQKSHEEQKQRLIHRLLSIDANLGGIIVSGPSGCGKTHFVDTLVATLANTHGCLRLECADLIIKEVGASEMKLSEIFSKASFNSPSIIVLENIDIIFSNESLTPVLSRILNALLQCMDFAQESGVCVIATASNMHNLTRTLLRKGRFDYRISLEFPDFHDVHFVLSRHFEVMGFDSNEKEAWIGEWCKKLENRSYGSIIKSLKQDQLYASGEALIPLQSTNGAKISSYTNN